MANQLTLRTLKDMLYRRTGNAGLSSRTCLSIVVWPAWCMESGAVLQDLSRYVGGPKLHLSVASVPPDNSLQPACS